MTNKSLSRSITAALLFVALSAHAADAPVPATTAGATESDDWASLQKEAATLKTRADIAKYRADIAKFNADARNSDRQTTQTLNSPLPNGPFPTGPLPSQGTANAPGTATPPSPVGVGRPTLVRIGLANGQRSARLEVNGSQLDVLQGDALDGGWTVVAVDASSVKLRHGKQFLVLR